MLSKKMKRTILIMIVGMALLIIGCFDFLTIDQPESAIPGEKFSVYLEVLSETDYDDENPHYGIFGMLLPTDWKVDSVYYDGDYGAGYAAFLHPDSADAEIGGQVDYWNDSLDVHFPPPEGMHWIVYQSVEPFLVTATPKFKYFEIYADLTVGEKGGNYNLGYFITTAAYELSDSSWYDVSLQNPIEITNFAPDLSLPDPIVFVNNTSSDVINLWDITDDESADSSLIYAFSSDITELVADFNDLTGDLTLTAEGYVGTGKLYVEVTDPGGAVGYDTTNIQVESSNIAPNLSLPDSIVFVNNTSSDVINLWDITEDESAGSSLIYAFSSDIAQLVADFNDQTGDLTLTADGYVGTGKLYVEVTDPGGEVGYDTTNIRVIDYTNISDRLNPIPTRYKLYANFPNPFNPSTTIAFDLIKSVEVRIEVFDTMGRKVSTLVDGVRPAGSHQIIFTVGNLSSGVYYYVITTQDFRKSQKMLLIK